nr:MULTISPECIES: polymorphic toxin type 50 domain-containing protein [unclassified Bacillus (in: firmicutes)]
MNINFYLKTATAALEFLQGVAEFGQVIGKYYDMQTGKYLETTRGMIHYGKDGAHIVPSKPLEP